MTRVLRKFSKKVFIALHISMAITFLLVCCTGFLNPGHYWYIAILGIGFPFIVLALLAFIFLWWIFPSRWMLLSIIVLGIGWRQVYALFGLHAFTSFHTQKPEGALRIMQWNVARMDQVHSRRAGGSHRQPILDFIQQMNPDVVCMEEFLESNNAHEMVQNIPYFTHVLQYPYHFFARDYRRWDGMYEHGVIIFSKYPFLDTMRLRYSGPDSLNAAESLIRTDIDAGGRRIRILATHLQSLLFDGNDYNAIHTIARAQQGSVGKSKTILRKFRDAYALRSRQAEIVRREMDESPFPVILCSDFNDVPNSFTYSRIAGNYTDAFLARGFGMGRTFASLSPTLRIDYILADKKLAVLQFKQTPLPYSDHYPLVADLALPADKDAPEAGPR